MIKAIGISEATNSSPALFKRSEYRNLFRFSECQLVANRYSTWRLGFRPQLHVCRAKHPFDTHRPYPKMTGFAHHAIVDGSGA
jgi:hypothetical protein